MKQRSPRLLFIKLKHYGDVLLMTPTLAAVRTACPGAHITVLLRAGTEKILEGCPHIDEVLVTVPPEKKRRTVRQLLAQGRLLLDLRAQPGYDIVFELSDGDRGRWLGALCHAGMRCASSYGWSAASLWRKVFQDVSEADWNTLHRVEKDYHLVRQFLPMPARIPPLVFETTHEALALAPADRPYVVLHPTSRWKCKRWTAQGWAEVGRRLTESGYACVVSCGPETEEVAYAQQLATDIGAHAVSTQGSLSWMELARLLRGARLFVGVDTAAMHLAAACRCPVVTLFGPSIEHHWHPWQTRHEIVAPGGPLHHRYPDYLYDAPGRLMLDIDAQQVIAACHRMINGGPMTPALANS